MEYILANPTGNITALVTDEVAQEERLSVVKEIFETEPSCEQVGFVDIAGEKRIRLEMMGGEFCGNATLSSAAYLAKANHLFDADNPEEIVVTVDSSGAEQPVETRIRQLAGNLYEGTLEMPMPSLDGRVVHLDGISHMIVPSDTMTHEEAEATIKGCAEKYDALAFGMVLYSEEADSDAVSIEPLVYVKGSDTMVWEHGCASGSIAAAYYRHSITDAAKISVHQPGGIITIDITEDKLYLTGKIEF